MVDVGVMLLAHQRHQLLPLIVEQIKTMWPGVSSQVDIALDRPTIGVSSTAALLFGSNWGVRVLGTPEPAIDSRENFVAIRRWQLDQLRPFSPIYCCIWDDDHILEDPEEMANLMDEGHDLIYADKAYLWNSPDLLATHLPLHRSPFMFRLRPGDQFPEDPTRMLHAPVDVHDHPGSTAHGGRLLDIGYMAPAERERVWKVYKRAGKIDALTMGLVRPATTQAFRSESPWYERLKNVLATA